MRHRTFDLHLQSFEIVPLKTTHHNLINNTNNSLTINKNSNEYQKQLLLLKNKVNSRKGTQQLKIKYLLLLKEAFNSSKQDNKNKKRPINDLIIKSISRHVKGTSEDFVDQQTKIKHQLVKFPYIKNRKPLFSNMILKNVYHY